MTISLNTLLVVDVGDIKTTPKNTYNLQPLKEFEIKVDWDKLVDIVFQPYLESGIGRLINPAETMLKTYFLQYHYGMSASYIEKKLIKNNRLKQFVLTIDAIPKATDIEAFANLLHNKKLTEKIDEVFSAV